MSARPAGFAGRTFGWLVAGAVLSFLIAFLVSAFGEELGQRQSAGSDSYSFSALGHRGLYELLERQGHRVERHRLPASELVRLAEGELLLLLEPPPGGESEELRERLEIVSSGEGQAVIALPKWAGWPTTRPDWIGHATELDLESIESRLHEGIPYDWGAGLELRSTVNAPSSCTMVGGASFEIEIESLNLLQPLDGLEAVVRCGDEILVGTLEATGITLVADPDLLNNAGLGRADHADLLQAVLASHLGLRAALFDETIHGMARGSGLLATLLEFPVVLMVLHALLLLGLILWAGMVRFGSPPPRAGSLTDGKRVLIDNASQLLSLGGHSRDALVDYFDQTKRAVGAHYFFAPDLPAEELEGRLQGISRARGLELDLARLHQRIDKAAAGRRGSSDRAVRLADTIHHWRQEMIDGSRTDSRPVDRSA